MQRQPCPACRATPALPSLPLPTLTGRYRPPTCPAGSINTAVHKWQLFSSYLGPHWWEMTRSTCCPACIRWVCYHLERDDAHLQTSISVLSLPHRLGHNCLSLLHVLHAGGKGKPLYHWSATKQGFLKHSFNEVKVEHNKYTSQTELSGIFLAQTMPKDVMVRNKCFPYEEAHWKQK